MMNILSKALNEAIKDIGDKEYDCAIARLKRLKRAFDECETK